MLAVRLACQHCDTIVEHDETKVVGCNCDSDAPTWIGIGRDGRIISMSYASYEYLPKAQP